MMLLQILRLYSDMDHKLTMREIITLLANEGIETQRKTLYEDLKTLEEFGFEVEYDDNAYYLAQAPFTLSEIKIISDSLNSLKNLDDRFLKDLKDKLYSFISVYEVRQLKKLEYHEKHKDKKFINRLEDCLNALIANKALQINIHNRKEEIVPLFLHRQNDYYYLYYHYLFSDRIYHVRFDNINSLDIIDKHDDIHIERSRIDQYLQESSRSYHSSQVETISFEICEDSPYLRSALQDDFPNIIFTNEGFVIRSSISEVFFSRLLAYGTRIKISDPLIAEQYSSFLNKVLTHNNSPSNSKT